MTANRRGSTYSLLDKIINHRENKGFFYLHPYRKLIEADCRAVVDLRTSFALHRKHYEQILRSRKASLTEVFAHKLGWMVGSLFSRVPNKEWDEFKPHRKGKQFVEEVLEQIRTEKHANTVELEVPLFPFDSAVKHLTPQAIRNLSPDRWETMNSQLQKLHRRLKRNKPKSGGTDEKPTKQQRPDNQTLHPS